MMIRKLVSNLIDKLTHFGRSESGMTLPLLAVSMVMITGMVGMGIDTGRAQLVQSKLQFSLDAAGLAGSSTVNTANLQTEVTKYMNVNFNGYLGSTLTNVSAVADETNTIITLSASATIPTAFLGVVDINTMTVNAYTKINRSVTGLELVMVLDNTGSMNSAAGAGVTKISALKTSANTLVNTLFNGQATAPPNLYIGLVPFSQAVNIGTSHPGWMDATYGATLNWYTTSWAGCVDARLGGRDITDDPPAAITPSTLYQAYYWPSDTAATIKSKTGRTTSQSNTMFNTYTSWPTYNSQYNLNIWQGRVGGVQRYASPLNRSNQGPNYLCPQEVTPMTTTKATLTTAINAMTAQGNTVINQGMHWGWNMISPRWRGQWGGTMNSNNLPLDYGTKGMNKAIVLLTDGENTIDNSSHGSYWYLSDGRLGTTNSSLAVTEMNKRTLQICTSLKAQGVYIYTIALGTDLTAQALTMLQSCATASNYFFNSPSTSQLQSVFAAIGDSLSNLRVSQ